MKIIFVTGGSISGLGKGITASSIGKLLKSTGVSVGMVKMDPYLQVDAGTMSPYEHGEVFVTDDGTEADLDLGNYERFIDDNLSADNNITTGKVYLNVINKERVGEYLGKTVQIIPHITNEIKDNILKIAETKDVTIVEVGGTVGDIESQPFLETIRQMKDDLGVENTFFVHVAPLLHLSFSGETKTKLIQHSVIKLREYGISANIIVCRSDVSIDDSIREKLSRLCGVSKENIIEGKNAKSIYEVPELFRVQDVDKIICEHFGFSVVKANLTEWNNLVKIILEPKNTVKICVIGKYAEFEDTYKSVNEAFIHAGVANKVGVELKWVSSIDLEKENYSDILNKLLKSGEMDSILIPGGFGYRGIEGKINGVRFARENNIPFLGICLGLQVAVIEFARNVCKLEGANSSEFDETSKNLVIDFMTEQRSITKKGGTMRLGSYDAVLNKGSLVHSLYGKINITERHRHRYEVNPKYHELLEKNGLTISGLSPNRELVEFIEIEKHPFFIATQAHPEFKSRLDKPHPLFHGLIKASIK